MAIKITADRMIDLSDKELNELGIAVMPCFINMDGQSFEDLVDINPEAVFNHFEKTGELAKTAAKTADHYADFFRPFIENGDSVLHFAASSGISTICGNATRAGEMLGNVYVVDTRTLSNGIAILAKYAVSLINSGETDIEKIHQLCIKKREKVCGAFIIESLDCLHKGGRCSSLQYYGASLLKIRPVICMDSTGHMRIREKYFGNFRQAVLKAIATTFRKNPNPDLSEIYLLHFCADKSIEDFLAEAVLSHHPFKKIHFADGSICTCNCAIHSGRNTVGIFFVNKD